MSNLYINLGIKLAQEEPLPMPPRDSYWSYFKDRWKHRPISELYSTIGSAALSGGSALAHGERYDPGMSALYGAGAGLGLSGGINLAYAGIGGLKDYISPPEHKIYKLINEIRANLPKESK